MNKSSLSLLVILSGVLLSLLSLTMLASIAPNKILMQLIYALATVLLSIGVYRLGINNLLLTSKGLYVGVVLLLIATIVFGRVTRGSSRWLELWGLRLQTSELSKPIILLTGVTLLPTLWPTERRQQLLRAAIYAVTMSPALILVLIQPDLGSALILGVIVLTLAICSGLPRWLWIMTVVLGILALPLAGQFLEPYQRQRLESFMNPYSDPRGSGYNVIQSTIAIGSGQLVGRGLGHGTQSHLKFLPERQTDFIFASLVEELGLIGGMVVLGLYTLMFYGLVRLTLATSNPQHFLILTGMTSWFFFQTATNIGMNLGILPVTGITLPFLSAGGSSLLVSGMVVALVASIANQGRV